MFLGTHYVIMDEKGRVLIPAKLREVLTSRYSGSLILTNFDTCIAAYPREEWTILQEKVRSLPSMDVDVRQFVRYFSANAEECEMDRSGRILVPLRLRNFANLNGEVVLLGVMNKIELWNRSQWDSFLRATEEKFSEIARRLASMGL